MLKIGELSLHVGDKLRILVKNKKIILEPIKKERKKYNIDDLVKKLPKNYNPYEEFESKVGLEEW